jgi:hypothetical protein
VRRGLTLAVVLLAAGTPAAVAATWYWPMTKVMRVLDGTRVRVGTAAVRIQSETTLCSGQGRSIRRNGVRRWSRFACTYTTFTRRGVDRDLDFRVLVRGQRRFRIVDAHWVPTPR